MRMAGSKTTWPGPAQPLDRTPGFQALAVEGTPKGATGSAGQLESSPPTLCHFLVEQAQSWPRHGAPSWNPHLRDPGELLEGQGEEWALNLERDQTRKGLERTVSPLSRTEVTPRLSPGPGLRYPQGFLSEGGLV